MDFFLIHSCKVMSLNGDLLWLVSRLLKKKILPIFHFVVNSCCLINQISSSSTFFAKPCVTCLPLLIQVNVHEHKFLFLWTHYWLLWSIKI